ncbi:hypothetical protein [Lactobacillus delbrueckii]|uniref:hypothetical protein n=1 Tax=Lactobacillus delbrueckii TaxID=1584 RepID=UPI0012DB679D|nr:hypothetical protein [Lactobacillus delbrueckii]
MGAIFSFSPFLALSFFNLSFSASFKNYFVKESAMKELNMFKNTPSALSGRHPLAAF